jgi:hypothetical protein
MSGSPSLAPDEGMRYPGEPLTGSLTGSLTE